MTLYWAIWWIARGLARLLFRYRVEGLEHVPRTGGLIIASNHASNVDPPIIGVAVKRELCYVAKAELFSVPFLGWFISQLNAIPISRGKADRAAMMAYQGRLKSGYAIFIAPEGRRNKTGRFLEPKAGAGMLVYRAEVPVVPAYISGTRSILKALLGLEPIRVRFGPAVAYPRSAFSGRPREAYQSISQDIMHRIQAIKQGGSGVGTASPASSLSSVPAPFPDSR